MCNLERVEFGTNQLGHVGAHALVKALGRCIALEEIGLNDNQISEAGLDRIMVGGGVGC